METASQRFTAGPTIQNMTVDYDHKLGGYPQEVKNTSGWEPSGRAVLIKPYEPEKLSTTIAIPETVRNRLEMVEQFAVVVAIGENAWHDEPVPRAKVGDHVIVTRYAGFILSEEHTEDGETYRVVNDRDIFMRKVR